MEPGTVLTLATMVASSFGAVGTLGWWLSGQFRAVEISTQKMIREHEEVDSRRHEENQVRLGDIDVTLARLGAKRSDR